MDRSSIMAHRTSPVSKFHVSNPNRRIDIIWLALPDAGITQPPSVSTILPFKAQVATPVHGRAGSRCQLSASRGNISDTQLMALPGLFYGTLYPECAGDVQRTGPKIFSRQIRHHPVGR